jgi:preprotein translocase subunit SecF
MALFPLRFFKDTPNYDFLGKRWVGFALSGLVVLAAIFLLVTKGLNWGIDFTGGVLMEVRTEKPASLADFRPLFPTAEYGEVTLQHFGDDQEVLIRFQSREGDDQQALIARVKEKLAETNYQIDYRKVDYVGPTVGKELIQSGTLAMILAIIAILIYIWFRFEWQFGLGAVLALLHDLVATLGFISFMGFEFGLASIAAILTILGYSINDSVVLFDRVREMRRKFKKMPLMQMLNESINLNLSRTLLTSGTTLLALIALVTLGGEVIRGFVAAILFGVVAGTYSSIYISLPILIYFKLPDDRPMAESKIEQTA